MNLLRSLSEALIHAPLSLRKCRQQSFVFMALYFCSATIIFSVTAYLLIQHEQELKSILLDYLIPKNWQSLSEQIVEFFFASQAKVVISSMIIGASLVFSSVLLFLLKEKYSSVFEREAGYENGPSQDYPLHIQAWEEIKLFLLYITAQLVILWIGYYPYPWANALSITLSFLFLFFTFGLDFISPTFQRHKIPYVVIVKFLVKKFIVTITFGIVFSLPVILLGHFILKQEQLSLVDVISILFLVNILFLTLAVPAGTHLASQLITDARATQVPSTTSRTISYTSLFILLIAGLILHSRLILSMHHKSQFLKAEYDIHWSSFDLKLSSLFESDQQKSLGKLSFDLTIINPTQFDLEVEKSQLLIEKGEHLISKIQLSPLAVAAGDSETITLTLDATSDFSSIDGFGDLLKKDWRIDWELELFPGIPFIINIVKPD